MEFFDCNTFIGTPSGKSDAKAVTVDGLLAELDRAGIKQALLWHAAQRDHDPKVGNRLLADAIAGQSRLVGCFSPLPPQTEEMGNVDEWLAGAAKSGALALRAFPKSHHYLLRWEVLGELFEAMLAVRMPLLISPEQEASWEQIYDVLAEFPELRVILCDVGCWGKDRLFRPLLERYPNVLIELSAYLLDGGIESLVARYGARRLLFGSNFPAAYHGGMMLALKTAEISDEDKAAIAGTNLERLLGEVKL